MGGRDALLRRAAWVGTRGPARRASGPLPSPPLPARPSAERPPSPGVAWCFAALPQRLLGASNSSSCLGTPYSYPRPSPTPPSPVVPSLPDDLPLEVFHFPLTLFFLFLNYCSVMPACFAEAEPETGHLLLAGPMVPQSPCQACGGPENTNQGGAGGWENLQVVCVWPQQEAALL